MTQDQGDKEVHISASFLSIGCYHQIVDQCLDQKCGAMSKSPQKCEILTGNNTSIDPVTTVSVA